MEPHPIVGKHYELRHKRFPPGHPFRGIVCIKDIGSMDGKLIFSTYQTGKSWFWWNDYNYEYVGDLQ